MPGRQTGLARRARRRVHVDGELRPVTRGEVRVSVRRESTGCRCPGFHGAACSECTVSGPDCSPSESRAYVVTRGRRHVPEQQPAERVGALRLEGLSRRSDERHLRGGCEAGDVHLLGAADRVEGRRCAGSQGGRRQADDERHARQHRKDPCRVLPVAWTLRPASPGTPSPPSEAAYTHSDGRLTATRMGPGDGSPARDGVARRHPSMPRRTSAGSVRPWT